MSHGTVKWFNNKTGFGFVRADGSDKDIFAHYSQILCKGFKILGEGQEVEFDIVENPQGLQAYNIKPLGPVPVVLANIKKKEQ